MPFVDVLLHSLRRSRRTLTAVLSSGALLLAFSGSSHAQVVYELEHFEGPLRVVQPNETSLDYRYLWSIYTGNGQGTTDVTTAQKHDGSQSLRNVLTSGVWQFQFYSYTDGLAGFSNGWQFMRKFVTNPTSYQTNRVNRMRFWMKVPQGTDPDTGGNHNFELGTFVRCSTCSGQEDGGGHWYHHYNLMYTGEWHQVIVDTHPSHQRGGNGSTEWGDQLHPTGESNFTYFDLITRFYLDFPYETYSPMPATFYIDGFELYEETRSENVAQIYSMNAVYIPSSNTVRVGWQRNKNEDSVRHEVRYAFSDIHALGWANATVAPNGTITPPGSGGYNGMEWSSTALNLSGRTMLYVAIKPQNSSLMRQITIPLTSTGGPPPAAPSAPQNLRIVTP